MNTGREGLSLQGHKGTIFAMSFSPDGKRVATAGEMGRLGLGCGLGKLSSSTGIPPLFGGLNTAGWPALATASSDGLRTRCRCRKKLLTL